MTHYPSTPEELPKRPVRRSLGRGLTMRCPNCGTGALFDGYLKAVDACSTCGEEMHHHRADDAHPYLTILVLGHIMIPLLFWLDRIYEPAMEVMMGISIVGIVGLALLVLRPMKGMVIGLQWALRMHGFGGHLD